MISGTHQGGLKTAIAIREKYGTNHWETIGKIGGERGKTGGFASNVVGDDGLTGRQRAITAGAKGGRISRRKPSIKSPEPRAVEAAAFDITDEMAA